MSQLKSRKDSHVHFVDHPDCPVCLSTLKPPAVECEGGHMICEGCLPQEKLCPVCDQPYPATEIEQPRCQQPLLKFMDFHGLLIKVSNEGARVIATGSDMIQGYLAYAFFDQPIRPFEQVSVRVSMGNKKSVYLIAGFANEDPKSVKNVEHFFNSSCSMEIRSAKRWRANIHLNVNQNGKIVAQMNGKSPETFPPHESDIHKSINTRKPIWGFIRIFHKSDQIEIFS